MGDLVRFSSKVFVAWLLLNAPAFAQSWKVDALPRISTDGIFLDFELTYLAARTVEVYEANLPWGVRYSTQLVAIPLAEGAKALDGALYIDDPGPKTRRVSPGEKIKGSIDLTTRFKAISRSLRRSSVVVCFRYDFSLLQSVGDGVAEKCVIFEQLKHSRKNGVYHRISG
jgi:hypothetical protein